MIQILLVLVLMVSGCSGSAEAPITGTEEIAETSSPDAEQGIDVDEPETGDAEGGIGEPGVGESPPEGSKALELCSRITGFAEKQSCTGKVAEALASKDPERAILTCDGSEDTDTCYQMIAPVIAESDVARARGLCSGITAQYQDTCYARVAEAAKDESVCEEAGSKDMCYSAVAPTLP